MAREKIKAIYGAWLLKAKKIAAFETRVVFTLSYFALFVPMGLVFRLFSRKRKSGFSPANDNDYTDDLESARRQF